MWSNLCSGHKMVAIVLLYKKQYSYVYLILTFLLFTIFHIPETNQMLTTSQFNDASVKLPTLNGKRLSLKSETAIF